MICKSLLSLLNTIPFISTLITYIRLIIIQVIKKKNHSNKKLNFNPRQKESKFVKKAR